MSILLTTVLALLISRYVVYYVALVLFIVIMPLVPKYRESWWFPPVAFLPALLGYVLDVYWNVVHFTIKLYFMDKSDGVKTFSVMPDFGSVHDWDFYPITLTGRLQGILNTYPLESKAYKYALKMSEMLNKYDKDHLVVTRGTRGRTR